MRHSLLATALSCGFALALPAMAQTPAATSSPQAPSVDKPATAAANTPAPPPPPPMPAAPAAATPPATESPAPAPEAAAPSEAPMKKPMHKPMMKGSEPMSGRASHIAAGDTAGDIAPRLPSPKLGASASPDDYLMAAKQALKMKRTGEAQEALEMAETRMLDRSTAVDQAGSPSSDPHIAAVHDALTSLSKSDMSGTEMAIDHAMSGKPAMAPMEKPMHHKMMMHKKAASAAPAPAPAQ